MNSRLITPDETWDDYPDCEPLEMGSAEEADMLTEWSRWELVDLIQNLDQRIAELEKENAELKEGSNGGWKI